MTYSHPSGRKVSTTVLPIQATATAAEIHAMDGSLIDKDGLVNGLIRLGSLPNVDTTMLVNPSTSYNVYFLTAYVNVGTPWPTEINIPVTCSPKGSLGDFIWKDTNDNGIQDVGEAGQAGVIVELYKNGVATGLKDTTDIVGKYLFTKLDSASYQVKINTSSLPSTCALSAKQNVTADNLDNDFNATTGLSDAVVVNPYSSDTNQVNIRTVDGALVTVVVCNPPIIGLITATQATCSGNVANNNASVNLTGITNGDKYSLGTNTTSFTYNSAINFTGSMLTLGGLLNPTTTTLYYVRIYNSSDNCYTTVSVNLIPKNCAIGCQTGINCLSIGITKN